MAAHTQDQKYFIVRHLAKCYSRPEVVRLFVRAYPDTRCDIEDVRAYDPHAGLTDVMLCAVYAAVQAEFLAEPPRISKRNYRLAVLQRLLDDALDRGAPGLQMAVLAQAAAECASGGPTGTQRVTEIIETIIDPVLA